MQVIRMKGDRAYRLAGLVILLLCWLPGGRYFSALAAVPVEYEIVNVLDSAVDALALLRRTTGVFFKTP